MSNSAEVKPERLRQAQRRKGQLTRRNRVFLILAAIFLVFIASGYVKNIVASLLVEVVPGQPSVLEEVTKAEFVIIRNEAALAAPFTGRLEILRPEGERVAKGTVMCYLVSEDGTSLEKTKRLAFIAPQAGVVSYHIDGYENICNSQIWPQLDIHQLTDLEKRLGAPMSGDAKEKKVIPGGSFFVKVIDNLSPGYLYLETTSDLGRELKTGNSIEIRLEKLDNLLIRGNIMSVAQNGDKLQLLIRIPNLPETYKLRKLQGHIITNKYRGTVLSEHCLVEKEGNLGVFIYARGKVQWKEVTVSGRLNKKVAVEGLSASDLVITTPQLVKEGQVVFFPRRLSL
ncbi:hypothetical protein BR63_01745 [Thermanaerosceptrum fracticalcis]|uniref:RND related barrel-sandwich hybrid domain-containing protein n=1 Tax=Thermanaerosceptrum fracticalcis TaxID=1712410 RepID=A0A7G6DZA0_THEFR|nr:HlyD family efflux transporter periplasmic adaptor subunit [Thermanaerosceptrum fracticalcis]QNB45154.1 hypothetical protein BR63_01745 [Thermanaerosceptrum fracticalcis]